jgi:hypothetical protein
MNTVMARYCFALPLLPGGVELHKKWNVENIRNNKEHDEVFNAAGITIEQSWIQHLPQGGGDLAVLCIETNDVANAFRVLATYGSPWARKFREYGKKAYGIDFAQPPPGLNEMVTDWHAK